MNEICERCGAEGEVETFSYRVVCADGSINMDVKYCSDCCDEIENEHKAEANE